MALIMAFIIAMCTGWVQCKFSWTVFFVLSLLLTAPSFVDLCPGPFEDTQFDAVIDVETSDDCMDDKGIYS